MARMAGIPARIVTGYKADRTNSVKNYLAVKEKDAHAWTEVYLDKQWIRVDPTATASRIDTESAALLRQTGLLDPEGRWMRVNLYLMYVKYQVETWILQYSHFRQMQLMDKVKNHPEFAAKFSASLLAVILGSLGLFLYLHRPRCSDSMLCAMWPVLKRLQKEGYTRTNGETLHQLFIRYLAAHPERDTLLEIDRLYHRSRYGDASIDHKAFKRIIYDFLRRSA
jgi:hypothetical protein